MTVQTKIQDSKALHNVLSVFKDDSIEPFDVDYQNRFLNVFITDKSGFPERIIDIVEVEYFDAYQKILLDYELKFFSKYREIARFQTLKEIINQKEKGLNKDHLLGLISKIEEIEIENSKHIQDSSSDF